MRNTTENRMVGSRLFCPAIFAAALPAAGFLAFGQIDGPYYTQPGQLLDLSRER